MSPQLSFGASNAASMLAVGDVLARHRRLEPRSASSTRFLAPLIGEGQRRAVIGGGFRNSQAIERSLATP